MGAYESISAAAVETGLTPDAVLIFLCMADFMFGVVIACLCFLLMYFLNRYRRS